MGSQSRQIPSDEQSHLSAYGFNNLQDSLGLSSVNLSSIREQTAKVSTQVFSSLKAKSHKVSKLLWNDGANGEPASETRAPHPRPTILEQLKWPVLIDNKRQWLRHVGGNKNEDEEDIVDKFIRVITIEDVDEHPEDTFYNHPARVCTNTYMYRLIRLQF